MSKFDYWFYYAKCNAYGCYDKKRPAKLARNKPTYSLNQNTKISMKKLFFLFLAIAAISFSAFSQKAKPAATKPAPAKTKVSKLTYRVGLASSLPTDTYQGQTKISIGSTFFEAGYSYSKKITLTANSGYLRYTNGGESFAQIPLLVGAKYHIDNMFYFGISSGATTYNKFDYGKFDFMYSPYIGIQAKRLSFDVRYYNTLKTNPIKTTALVFSYTL